jgi:hypothetical protein
MTAQPLSEEDFERLSDLLELFGDLRSMKVEEAKPRTIQIA